MKSPERKPRFPFRAFLCPCVALTWGAVPSTMAVRIRGICTPSRELGSPEQYRYSTSSPRSSIALPTRRIMVDFPAPGPPFRTIRSWWSSGLQKRWNRFWNPCPLFAPRKKVSCHGLSSQLQNLIHDMREKGILTFRQAVFQDLTRRRSASRAGPAGQRGRCPPPPRGAMCVIYGGGQNG